MATLLPAVLAAEEEIPLGAAYRGPRCAVTVGDFAVQAAGAPGEIGEGLREMLQTALFESNYFLVAQRSDPAGISAEQLLSDSFLSDPDAILEKGRMRPAEVLLYGAVTSLEGGGLGVRVKVPGAPLKIGSGYSKARVAIELQAVDSATGNIISAQTVEGTALSGRGSVGTSFSGIDMPVALEAFNNTPLELAIRDCIYRAVISLIKGLPQALFKYEGSGGR